VSVATGFEPPHPVSFADSTSPRWGEVGLGGSSAEVLIFRTVAGDRQFAADRFQHAVGVRQHVVVPEAEDAPAMALDRFRARGVAFGTVLAAVQFDREARRAGCEIGGIEADLALEDEFLAVEAPPAQARPQPRLGVRAVGAQAARDGSEAALGHAARQSRPGAAVKLPSSARGDRPRPR